MCARRISHTEARSARRQRCFREGSRDLPGGGIRGSPRPRGSSNRGSGGFPGGKPVNVCAPDLPFSARVGCTAGRASASAMRPEREVP